MEEQQIINIVIPFLWLIIPLMALIGFYKIRTNYKIAQLKEEKKVKKSEESISGGLAKMIGDAPNQLKQINSEIATIEEKCKRENVSETTKKELLSRLYQERDMLQYAVKYGGLAQPFLKPIDKIVNNLLSKVGGS